METRTLEFKMKESFAKRILHGKVEVVEKMDAVKVKLYVQVTDKGVTELSVVDMYDHPIFEGLEVPLDSDGALEISDLFMTISANV